LRLFISGSVICWLILPIIYANTIFDAIKYLRSLTGAFLLFLAYIIGSLIYHIIGITWITDSKCVFLLNFRKKQKDNTYYGSLAVFTLVAFFIMLGLMFLGMTFIFIKACFTQSEKIVFFLILYFFRSLMPRGQENLNQWNSKSNLRKSHKKLKNHLQKMNSKLKIFKYCDILLR